MTMMLMIIMIITVIINNKKHSKYRKNRRIHKDTAPNNSPKQFDKQMRHIATREMAQSTHQLALPPHPTHATPPSIRVRMLYRVAQKVSHYQIIKKIVKSYKRL